MQIMSRTQYSGMGSGREGRRRSSSMTLLVSAATRNGLRRADIYQQVCQAQSGQRAPRPWGEHCSYQRREGRRSAHARNPLTACSYLSARAAAAERGNSMAWMRRSTLKSIPSSTPEILLDHQLSTQLRSNHNEDAHWWGPSAHSGAEPYPSVHGRDVLPVLATILEPSLAQYLSMKTRSKQFSCPARFGAASPSDELGSCRKQNRHMNQDNMNIGWKGALESSCSPDARAWAIPPDALGVRDGSTGMASCFQPVGNPSVEAGG